MDKKQLIIRYMKYRAKEEVEAIRFTRNNWEEVVDFTNGQAHSLRIEKRPGGLVTCKLDSKAATLEINEFDYIIKDLRMGTDEMFFSRRRKDIFESMYSPVFKDARSSFEKDVNDCFNDM
jgi:hypothetical protein